MSASELFSQANAAFVEEDYTEALLLYSSAINADPSNPDYYLKRAITNHKTKKYKDAFNDASAAVMLSEGKKDIAIKANLRKGMAQFELGQYHDALSAFESVISMEPGTGDKTTAETWIKKCREKVPAQPIPAPTTPAAPQPVEQQQQQQTPPAKVRHEWFQNENFVTIEVFIKKVNPNTVSVQFAPKSLELTVKLPTGSDFSFDLDPLSHEIVPEQSKFSILSTKIELKLKKQREGVKWRELEGEDNSIATMMAQKGEDKPVYPSSAKKRVDWSSIEKTVEEEKPEGDQALNALFQKIYRDANDDVRKAMVKSFTESGGTALSTNWAEVGSKKVDISPPDGMVAKKYEL